MNLFSGLSRLIQGKAAAPKDPLQDIIIPSARDRWLSANVASYTPETIETTIRQALAGNMVAVWELFDLMEGTWYRLQKNLQELKRAVVGLEWSVQAWADEGAAPDAKAKLRRKLFSDAIWSMRPNPTTDQSEFEDTVWHLLDAWSKGISVLEVDWEQRPGLIAPRSTRWVHPRYYGYPHDRDELMLNMQEILTAHPGGLGARLAPADYASFPPHKFLIGVCKQKAGHPMGSSLLRCLGFWWAVSNFSGQWMLNFAQLFGQPIRWATYDPNQPSLKQILSVMMQSMGSTGWAVMPAGTQLELKEAVKSGADNPQAFLLNFADKVCDILVLGQTLSSDVGDSGSRALGEVHMDVRADIIDAAGNWVAKVLNYQLVPAFCELNFGNADECPWFAPARKQVKDAKAMAERDQILSGMGLDLPEQWMRERHDVPAPQGGEAVLAPPSPAPAPPTGGPDMAKGLVNAKASTAEESNATIEGIIVQAVEDGLGARRRWLRPLADELQRLIALAKDNSKTDEAVGRLVQAGQERLPELFAELDVSLFSEQINRAAGAAALAGLKARLQ